MRVNVGALDKKKKNLWMKFIFSWSDEGRQQSRLELCFSAIK